MASVITEFLASVGFAVDEKSLKSSLTRVAAFGAAIKLVTAGIVAGVVKAAGAEAELAAKAELLGTTTEKLREMRYVADQSGVSLDSVTSAMDALVSKNPRIRDAAAALEEVGRKMKGMSDAQRRVYASRMGIDPKLIPMLASDVSGLKREFREMYAVAGVDAKEAAQASRELLGEIGKLKSIGELLKSSVASKFMGRVRDGIKRLRLFIVENFDRIKAVLAAVIDFFMRVSDVISVLVDRVRKWVSALLAWYDKLDDSQKRVVVGLGLFLAAWKLLNLGFIATPLGAIITALVVLVALIDDYLTYMRGGESYFGEQWEEWAEAMELVISILKIAWGWIKAVAKGLLSAIGPAIQTIKTFLKGVLDWLTAGVKLWKAVFTGDFAGAAKYAVETIRAFVAIFKNLFLGLVKTLGAFFKGLWAGVKENFPNFAAWAENAAAAIKNFFKPAFDWLGKTLGKIIDGVKWAGKKLGLIEDEPEYEEVDPEIAAAVPGKVMDTLKNFGGSMMDTAKGGRLSALVPSPAEAAAIHNNATSSSVSLKSQTTINVTSPDPMSAGRQVAAQQGRVNADVARNLKGAVK